MKKEKEGLRGGAHIPGANGCFSNNNFVDISYVLTIVLGRMAT